MLQFSFQLHIPEVPIRFSTRRLSILTEDFHAFPYSMKENIGKIAMASFYFLSNSPLRFILLFGAANDAVEYCNISRSLPYNCHKNFLYEASKVPYFLDSRLTDCDEVVGLTRR